MFRAVERSNSHPDTWQYLQGEYADYDRHIFEKPQGQLQHTESC